MYQNNYVRKRNQNYDIYKATDTNGAIEEKLKTFKQNTFLLMNLCRLKWKKGQIGGQNKDHNLFPILFNQDVC